MNGRRRGSGSGVRWRCSRRYDRTRASRTSIKKARSSRFAPWNDGPGRLTHRHGDVNPVFAALDQQRERLALRSFVDQLLELLNGLDHLAIDREHDVAFLNAGLGRRTLNCAAHHYAAFDFELLFLLGRQILYRESTLAGLRGRLWASRSRCLLVLHLTHGYRQRFLFALTIELHFRVCARLGHADHARQFARRSYRLAFEFHDDVAALETGLVGGTPGLDRCDQSAFRVTHAERLG